MFIFRLGFLFATFLAVTPALAARCGGDFNTFVRNISAEAAASGISQDVIASALGGVTQDMAVLAFARRHIELVERGHKILHQRPEIR